MSDFRKQAATSAAILAALPSWQSVCQRQPDLDPQTLDAILEEAARFAEAELAPLNAQGDRIGAQLASGRVAMPAGFGEAYKALAEQGWLGLDITSTLGGQDLPLTLHTATQSLFDRGCTALLMAVGASRSAAHLLAEHADEETKADWIPKLCAGEWSATICISEPDAGSDVGRIRTKAVQNGDQWQVTGEKIWISFGDHDMADRIGHCLLARTGDVPGTRGLSLFLVPSTTSDGRTNGITVNRLEEKLGMHASPTCALSFQDAEAILVGSEGRGLSCLFTMMEMMRLQTGAQGLGLALGAEDIANGYTTERRQGGVPDQPAPTIDRHADVRRQLLDIGSRNAVLHMAVLDLSATMDLARLNEDQAECGRLSAYASWMLPLIKTFGAEGAFDSANGAIQLLGGAGYTQEWPVEQILRDARVLAIYEGTTGMQAQDFLFRRTLKEQGQGTDVFLEACRKQIEHMPTGAVETASLRAVMDGFLDLTQYLSNISQSTFRATEFAAEPYLRAGWSAVSALMAARLSQMTGRSDLAALGSYRLLQLPSELKRHAGNCSSSCPNLDDLFDTAFQR
ncbi:acyl-CoA dehydrogenase family protein [Roseibium sp.]|uniref:acyl-CoA dehydrogenase family protein n=1 Tax=Roseibium sp. TaxID=1936156 RepID=UPI003A986A55